MQTKINWRYIEAYNGYDYYYYYDSQHDKVFNCCPSGESMPDTTQGGYYYLESIKRLKGRGI